MRRQARAVEQLIRVRRNGELLTTEELGPCRFVPLVGAEGYPEEG